MADAVNGIGSDPGGHWGRFVAEVNGFEAMIRSLPVVHAPEPAALRRSLGERFTFAEGIPLSQLADELTAMLRKGLVHVTHPRYFGLFNPSVREAAVLGDALAALYNPQLAVWSHAPVVQELERLTLATLARCLGYDPDHMAAHFASGGAEANFAAVLCALATHCPEAAIAGLRGLARAPRIYVSAESHHSFIKIARMSGLGTDAVRVVPVTAALTIDVAALDAMLVADRDAGDQPVLVVATAGTTSAGVIDPLAEVAAVAARHGAWFHCDAAWGGGAAMSPRLRPLLAGIERADSITWDAHKWLSVSMGAGMFFTRHPEAVARAFGVASTYMPPATSTITDDPHLVTPQWSRRAIGLKVFAALAELGLPGYARLIEHQAAMGEALRVRLREAGWQVVNDTPLPVVCFTHPDITAGRVAAAAVRDAIYARGEAWISVARLADGPPVLRACITSYQTTAADLDVLVAELAAALDARGA
jgi:glutamate/tyrosine decarboxylase-like PLP-dependent enzyme